MRIYTNKEVEKANEDWARGEGNLPPTKEWQAWSERQLTEWISYAKRLLRIIPFGNSKWQTISNRLARVNEFKMNKFSSIQADNKSEEEQIMENDTILKAFEE